MLTNVRPEGLAGIGVAVADALLGGDSFLAGLVAGDAFVVSDIPMMFGETQASSAADDLFGTDGSEPTAQWLELTIKSPDADPIVVRRTVFDRIDPEARAAGAVDRMALDPVVPGGGSTSQDDQHIARAAMWLAIATGITDLKSPVFAVGTDDALMPVFIPGFHHLLTEAAGHISCCRRACIRSWMRRMSLHGRSDPSQERTRHWSPRTSFTAVVGSSLPRFDTPARPGPDGWRHRPCHGTHDDARERGSRCGCRPIGLSVGAVFEPATEEGSVFVCSTRRCPTSTCPGRRVRLDAGTRRGMARRPS